jgi:hypothetical protein
MPGMNQATHDYIVFKLGQALQLLLLAQRDTAGSHQGFEATLGRRELGVSTRRRISRPQRKTCRQLAALKLSALPEGNQRAAQRRLEIYQRHPRQIFYSAIGSAHPHQCAARFWGSLRKVKER